MPKATTKAAIPEELRWIDQLSSLMDSRFKIPILNIRFGLDPILGLIPGVGDAITFAISALLVIAMARKGASGVLATKMVGNILIDLIIGGIPLLGDLFDFANKANTRNFKLLLEHYEEGKHQGSAWWVVFLLALILIGMWAVILYIVWLTLSGLNGWVSSLNG